MVFRSRFRMVASEGEGGIRKRTKFFVVVASLLCISAVYYVYSYSKQNTQLLNKQENLSIQVQTYSTVYKKCDRSLKTAKNDLTNFSDAIKEKTAKIKSQEKEIGDLQISSEETIKKFRIGLQFYLDAKVLLGIGDSGPIEQDIAPLVVDDLKKKIIELKEVGANYDSLKKSLLGLKGDFANLNNSKHKLAKEYQRLSGEAVNLREENKRLNEINTQISGKLEKSQKEMKNSPPKASVFDQVQEKISDIRKGMQKKIPTVAAGIMKNINKGLEKVGVIKGGKGGSKNVGVIKSVKQQPELSKHVAGVKKSGKQPELETRINVEDAAKPGEPNLPKTSSKVTEKNNKVVKGKEVDDSEVEHRNDHQDELPGESEDYMQDM